MRRGRHGFHFLTRRPRLDAWRKYRRLLHYALRYRLGWAAIVLVTLGSTAFGLLQPWPMKVLVDFVLDNQTRTGAAGALVNTLPGAGSQSGLLAWVVVASLVVFAVNSLFDVMLTWLWIRVGQQMVYDLARDLFSHIQRQSLLFHSRNSVGDSLSRITGDSWSVHTLVDALLFKPIHALIMVVAMTVVMSRLDLRLTVVSLAIAPIMGAGSLVFSRRLKKVARRQRENQSSLYAQAQRALAGIAVVQSFGQEERETRTFRSLAEQAVRLKRRSVFAGGTYSLSSGLITTMGRCVVLWFGALQVLHGGMSLGTLLVFVAYLGTLQDQLKVFADIYGTLQSTEPSVARVLERLEAEYEELELPGARRLGNRGRLSLPRGPARQQSQVVFEGVTFGYEAGRPVLQEVALEAHPGQTIAIVGPTGSGKSTLVGLLPRFFDPWQGRVLLGGHDLRRLELRGLRQQIALVLQEPFLFPVSLAENIAYGKPEASLAEIEAAAKAANAHEFIRELPQGYETVLGERGATLSGGQRQRLSIARALLKDAPLLILDEPTSALDAETEGLLLGALARLMEGRTTFIIAHRLSTIRQADQILVLEGGRIVERGSHVELLVKGGRYASFYHRQTGTLRGLEAVLSYPRPERRAYAR